MKYSKAQIDVISYELPQTVVTSEEIEQRLAPLYEKLHFSEGQLESLTGISERRWWDAGFPISEGAISAAKKTLEVTNVRPKDIEVLIYAGVCRENFEPATACKVAAALGISPDAVIYDLSNACLGVLNGIVEIANRIELGQNKAGLVVSCENAREIVEITIRNLLQNPTMENFIKSLATLTGGSGAVATLITDGSFSKIPRRRILGGASCTAPEFNILCRWGIEPNGLGNFVQSMFTDSIGILKHGVELGLRTWTKFLKILGWTKDQVHKTICHQVGATHRDAVLKTLNLSSEIDFATYPFLGNVGTVSLPITAAIAEEREFLKHGENVGFLGIGSGLNCLMLGCKW